MRVLTQSAIILALVLMVLGWLYHRERSGIKEYQDAHSAAKIIGKSVDEITSMYGKPYYVQSIAGGAPVEIVYKDVSHAQYCGIEIHNGIATKVIFWSQ
jgi:hypothetical protein